MRWGHLTWQLYPLCHNMGPRSCIFPTLVPLWKIHIFACLSGLVPSMLSLHANITLSSWLRPLWKLGHQVVLFRWWDFPSLLHRPWISTPRLTTRVRRKVFHHQCFPIRCDASGRCCEAALIRPRWSISQCSRRVFYISLHEKYHPVVCPNALRVGVMLTPQDGLGKHFHFPRIEMISLLPQLNKTYLWCHLRLIFLLWNYF